MTTTRIIDHDTERAIAESFGHTLGCLEIFTERLVEDHPELDLIGRHDDKIGSETLADVWTREIALTDAECDCRAQAAADASIEE